MARLADRSTTRPCQARARACTGQPHGDRHPAAPGRHIGRECEFGRAVPPVWCQQAGQWAGRWRLQCRRSQALSSVIPGNPHQIHTAKSRTGKRATKILTMLRHCLDASGKLQYRRPIRNEPEQLAPSLGVWVVPSLHPSSPAFGRTGQAMTARNRMTERKRACRANAN